MTTATSSPPGAPPGKGGGLLGKLKRKPALAAAVIGGGGLGLLLLVRKGKSNAAADAGTTSAQPGTIDPSLYGTPADLAGSGSLGATGDASTIEAQLTALQGQLASMTSSGATAQNTFKGSKYVTRSGDLQPWVKRRLGIGRPRPRGVRPGPIDRPRK